MTPVSRRWSSSSRQAEGNQFGFPFLQRLLLLLLGRLQPLAGALRFVRGYFTLGLDREQIFKCRQVPFGRLQAEHDRSVDHGHGLVELLFFSQGFLQLPVGKLHLSMAGVEPIGGSIFRKKFEYPAETGAANSQQSE